MRPVREFDDIILATRDEAESVLNRMYDLLGDYKMVTVAELYTMVGISGDFTNENWGWRNLQSAKIRRVRDGYLIDLPRPEEL